jgi:leader peptidase (prepilin peptidase)/N-methyltransferase
MVLSYIDYDYHAVPDSINLLVLSISFVYNDIYQGLVGATVISGVLVLIRYYVSFILQKEAMGEGDIILGASIGALLGVKLAFVAIFLASLLALPFALYDKLKTKTGLVPFIPFLSIATIVVFFNQFSLINILRNF